VSLEQVKKTVASQLQDDAQFLAPDEVADAIDSALRQVNIDRPMRVVADIVGDGSQDYALPASYVKGFSAIERVESPTGQNPPSYLPEDDDWFEYEDPTQAPGSQMRLRFKLSAPAVADTIRITMTGMWTLTLATDNLDPNAFQALIHRTLVLCYQALGSKFLQSQSPTIGADSVDYGTRAQTALFLSERNQTLYKQLVGQGKDIRAAHAMAEADIVFSGGEDMIWHPKVNR
jgi:hypothetical protein